MGRRLTGRVATAYSATHRHAILIYVRQSLFETKGPKEDINDRERSLARVQARRDAIALGLTGPLVTLALLLAWAVTGAGYFWPIWPMLGMSIALLVAIWRAFGPTLRPLAEPDVEP